MLRAHTSVYAPSFTGWSSRADTLASVLTASASDALGGRARPSYARPIATSINKHKATRGMRATGASPVRVAVRAAFRDRWLSDHEREADPARRASSVREPV